MKKGVNNMNNLILVAATAGTSVIDGAIKTAMEGGLDNLTATFNDVIGLVIPCAIGLIGISSGVNFALGKIRGLLGWAQ